MTTWPSASKATTTHTDSGTDKPRLARVDINQNILNTNDVIDMFNISSPADRQILQYNTANAKFELSSDFVGQGLTISQNNIISSRSNDDLVLNASGTGNINIGSNVNFSKNYIESISALTSAGTITVDCNTASVFTITLAHDVQFVISNIVAGQSVSIIIKQNSSTIYNPTFVQSDGSTAVLFPEGLNQISQTINLISVVNIFNTGSEYLGVATTNFRAP